MLKILPKKKWGGGINFISLPSEDTKARPVWQYPSSEKFPGILKVVL